MTVRTRVPTLSKHLLKATSSEQLICTEDCFIEVPTRFMTSGLGNLSAKSNVYGSLAILDKKGNYTVTNIPNLLEIEPHDITTFELDEDETEYYRFEFKRGQPVFLDMNVVMSDDLMYNILNEYIFKGKIPWYIEPDDLYRIFDFAKSHANSNIQISYQILELIISTVVRNRKNRQMPFRLSHRSAKTSKDFDFVPMANVYYGVQAPFNKLSGAYMQDGIISALVTKPVAPGINEVILRS